MATCTSDNLCNTFATCINNQSLNINKISVNETYEIRVLQSSAVDSLCTHSFTTNAKVTLFCAIHPSTAPSETPTGLPTAAPTIAPTQTPTSKPTAAPTPQPTKKSQSILYEIQYINNKNASCNNLVDNIGIEYDVTLTYCEDWCDNVINCKLFNYFDNFKAINHSRCYIFDHLCDVIIDHSTYESVIGYFGFEIGCLDYPYDWIDNVGDYCSYYELYNWCKNNSILRPTNVFQNYMDVTSQFTAMDSCCLCGGGIPIMDGVVFSIDNDWIDEDDIICKWMDLDINNETLKQWDNVALFDICINFIDLDLDFIQSNDNNNPCNAIIDTQFDDNNNEYRLHLCEYTDHNDFQFIFNLLFNNNSNIYDFYINTLWFNVNTSYYSSKLEIMRLNYSQCVSKIIVNTTETYRYGIHPCNMLSNINLPTPNPTLSLPSKSDMYSLQYIDNNASCVELYANRDIQYDITFANCSSWCDYRDDCQMFNYIEHLKQLNVSRCYIFDTICNIRIDNNIPKSIIGYYEFNKKCIDYPFDWTDNVGDDCNYYKSYNWCANSTILQSESKFDNLIDNKYKLTAMESCCECDGGISIVNNAAVSFDYWIDFTEDVLCKWVHSNYISTNLNLRNWNNMVLYNMCTRLKYVNCNFLIDILFDSYDYDYSLHICNYQYNNITNQNNEFIFDISINQEIKTYDIFINTLWFNLDFSRYSSNINIIHSRYPSCINDLIDDTRNVTHNYGVHPCYLVQTVNPTIDPTENPTNLPSNYPTINPTIQTTTNLTTNVTVDIYSTISTNITKKTSDITVSLTMESATDEPDLRFNEQKVFGFSLETIVIILISTLVFFIICIGFCFCIYANKFEDSSMDIKVQSEVELAVEKYKSNQNEIVRNNEAENLLEKEELEREITHLKQELQTQIQTEREELNAKFNAEIRTLNETVSANKRKFTEETKQMKMMNEEFENNLNIKIEQYMDTQQYLEDEEEETKDGYEATWKYKKMNKWTNDEISDWIQYMGLMKESNDKLLATIRETQCTGEDIQDLKTAQDVGDAFNIANNAILCELILTKITTFKPRKPKIKGNKTGNNAFTINISSHQKLLELKQKVTKDKRVKYVKQLYKEQLSIDAPIDHINFYNKKMLLLSDKTLEQVGIVDEKHLITVKFDADGGGGVNTWKFFD
eukprot:303468_1